MTNFNRRPGLLVALAAVLVGGCKGSGSAANDARPAAKEDFDLANADACELLHDARDAYLSDMDRDQGHQHGLMYVWLRENINHSPLLHIALDLADRDCEQAVDTANAIGRVDLRAYVIVEVAKIQHRRGHKEEATETLQAATDLLNGKDIESQSAAAIWPHVVSALLEMHGDVDAAKQAAEAAGCPWDAMDAHERQFQLARYHLSIGELDKARQDLLVLPADALTGRKAQQALAGDNFAAFYAWATRSADEPNAYTADHVLLEWLGDDGKPDEIETILRNLDAADVCKIDGYLKLVKRYRKAGETTKAAAALEQAEKLVDLIQDQDRQDRMKIYLAIQRPQADGVSLSEFVKASGVLGKHRGEPWLAALIPPLLEAGELPLAEQIAATGTMNVSIRGQFAIALTKGGKLAEAMAQVNQATEPLGPAKMLFAIAMQQKDNGDTAGADKTIFDAIARAKAVRQTNNWSPGAGEVQHQDKWRLMTWLYQTAMELGSGDRVIQQFDDDASIRQLARALAKRNEFALADKWLHSFSEDQRERGARCFLLLGLAEGLAKPAE